MRRLPVLLSLCALTSGAALLWHRSEDTTPGPHAVPMPTEHWQDRGAEKRHKSERKAWIESLHRTAPDVDWRAIERENGRVEMERRNALANVQFNSLDSWTEIGSKNLAGRMHCAEIGPDGPSGRRLYAGSSLGGVWRGDLDGTNWVPLGDNLYGGAHSLAVIAGDLPGDPDVILATTDGGSIHVTRDDGVTWESPAGLPNFFDVRSVAKFDDATDTLLIYGRFTNNLQQNRSGIFVSTDRGRNFVQRQGVGAWRGSVWVPRSGPGAVSTVYQLFQGRLRVSTSGGSEASFVDLATIDAGATRGVLTGSEAGAPTLYAALDNGGWSLYRSDDAGASFSFVYAINDFWESLCASTLDPDLVMFGGVEVWRSTNGGAGFAKINNWFDYYNDIVNRLHADIPGLFSWPDPVNSGSEIWYIATDGGLYESRNGGAGVLNLSLSGLGVSQYYSSLTSSSDPDLILVGAQDQGYQFGTWQPSTGSGPSTDFDQLISGDYGHLTSSDGTHGLVISTYPGFVLISEGEGVNTIRSTDFPVGANNAWLPPVVADPLTVGTFFFMGDQLYRYDRTGQNSWSINVHSTQNFLGGGASYLSEMAFAPSNAQRAYAVNNRGRFFSSSDHGLTWNEVVGGPDAHYFYGNSISVHPTNDLEAAVGGSGYSSPGVYRTVNGGASWQSISTGLPSTLVYDLAYAKDGSGDLYAATEAGAWRFDPNIGSWQNVMHSQTPLTTYWSVEALADGRIRFGTYGRGIWDYQPPAQPGTFVAYGENVGGNNTMSLSSQDAPLIGSTLTLEVIAFTPPTDGAWMVWSPQQASTPFAGGTLLVGPFAGLQRLGFEGGIVGHVTYSIPDDFLLIGTQVNFQAVGASASGFILSNGLCATIGS